MGKIDKFPYSDCIFCTVFVQKSNFFTNKLDAVLRREIHPARQKTENGADTSSSRRREYAAGSLLCVNEQGARSGNAEMRSIYVVFKVGSCLWQDTTHTTLHA